MLKRTFIPPQEKVIELDADITAPGFPKKILVLDDDPEMTQVLRELLELQHFLVVSVTSGVEGLREIMASDFDLILCDMMMPRLPGDMFYMAVERTKPHLCRRFIFITGHRGDKKVDEFIRKVRGIMLWKPFQTRDLMDTINIVLARNKGA